MTCDKTSDLWQQLNWPLNVNLNFERIGNGAESDLVQLMCGYLTSLI